jgi:hypothetical protein
MLISVNSLIDLSKISLEISWLRIKAALAFSLKSSISA